MKKLREINKLILYNWRPLLGFEIIYKLASAVIFMPLLWGLLDFAMGLSGYTYLTLENIFVFLTRPSTFILLAIWLFLAAVYAMIDISAVIFVLDQSRQEQRIHFSQIFRFAVRNAFRLWHPENFLLIIVVMLLMPFLNIGLASGVFSTIAIPEFILDYIFADLTLSLVLGGVTFLLMALMMKWLYALHYFTLEGCSFREARKRSRLLGKKKRIRDFMEMVLIQFLFVLFYLVFLFAAAALVVLAGKLFSGVFVLRWVMTTWIWMAIIFSVVVVFVIVVPVSYGCVSFLYYCHKEELNEPVIHSVAPPYSKNEGRTRFFQRCGIVCGVIAVAGSLVLGFFLCSGKLNPQIKYIRTMEITAHRGASAFYPENTMRAFEGAREMGADWIELDVQQSRDGQIIVMHDTNFRRTAGVDANTWELTYEEILELDVGSFFDAAYAGEKVPLLSEAAQFAKENGIKLNIELKPTGHETDFEKNVIDVIHKAGIEDACVITSQVYEVLEKVKACDDSVTTVYVMSLAYGDINQLAAADHFSVEATSATRNLISHVHSAGKEIYVWTVNTEEGINKMINLNAECFPAVISLGCIKRNIICNTY